MGGEMPCLRIEGWFFALILMVRESEALNVRNLADNAHDACAVLV